MNKKINFVIVIFILAISIFLRLWSLGSVPPSPDWDEAALGYNAYSLMETGRDEYGKFLPIILRSFDDYKPALYAYLTIPFVAIFGVSTVAVRFPSAIFGILTVLAVYLLVKELLRLKSKTDSQNYNFLPMLSSFLLAISPWHIQFSRIAFESNVGLAFNVFGVLFFIYGLKKPIFLTISATFMGLALYVYQSEKVFTPILFLLLIFVFRKNIFEISKKYLLLALVVGAIIIFPIANYTFTNEDALSRAKGVSVFSSDNQFTDDAAVRNIFNKEKNDYLGMLFDNRRVLYAKSMLDNYLSHYNFYWLFLAGDQPRHHAPEMGLMYLWELPFLLVGIYALIFGKFDKRFKLLIFGWFLIAPIPAAFTTGVPHAVRTLNFLPTFQVFIAIGIIAVLQKILNLSIKYLIFIFSILFLIFNFSYYINQYFVQQNYFHSEAWQYGYKEAVSEIKSIEHKYGKIIVSNKPHLDQSYIFFLFYLRYPPNIYQKESIDVSGGFRENHFFGKYEFRPIEWESEKKNNNLFVGRAEDFPKGINVIKRINFLNNKPAILIVEG
ncbi:MAG: glycosyltransferase family 39 protein [Candidatus Levybacteria bacterium]|nr:glycosyltransferase family 39 protein [Candidatus Levybacteria bacterium]